MFIMTHDNAQIINVDFVERFCIVQKDDAVLIVLSYSPERGSPAVTIGRYATVQGAQSVMDELFSALVDGQTYYVMPDRRYTEMPRKRDARTKRKGGS